MFPGKQTGQGQWENGPRVEGAELDPGQRPKVCLAPYRDLSWEPGPPSVSSLPSHPVAESQGPSLTRVPGRGSAPGPMPREAELGLEPPGSLHARGVFL